MGICGPTHDERSWTFDLDPGGRDPVLGSSASRRRTSPATPTTPGASPCRRSSTCRPAQVVTNDFAQITLDLSTRVDARYHRDGAPDLYPEALRDEIDEVSRARLPRRQQRRLPLRVRRHARTPTSEATTGCSTRLDWLDGAAGRRGATSSATRSPRPTSGCSRRWCASTPSTTATSSATGRSSSRCRCCGPTPATCSRRPGFGDTVDFDAHQAALLRRAHRHQPDRARAARPRPRRPGPRRTAARRSAAARSATAPRPGPPREVVPPEHNPALSLLAG